jgi:hypothetical protein
MPPATSHQIGSFALPSPSGFPDPPGRSLLQSRFSFLLVVKKFEPRN